MDNLDEILQVLVVGVAVALFLLQTCRYTKAIELFSECLVVLQKHSSKLKKKKLNEFRALIHCNLFRAFFLVGDYEKAINNGEKLFPLYEQIDDFEGAAGLLEKIGDAYQLTGELVKAKERYEKAFKLYVNDFSKLPNMSVIKQEERLNKMVAVATKTGNKEMEGVLLSQLGDLLLSLFQYAKAKDCFQRALSIWKGKGKRLEQGRTLNCLGKVCRKTEDYQQAHRHYEEAMEIFEAVDELKELGVACGELGKVYSSLLDFHQAKKLQQKALEISVKTGDKHGEAIDYRNLANNHTSLGEYDEAKECYQKTLAISKESGDRKGEAFVYSDLGSFFRGLNDLKRGEKYCKLACEIYREIGDELDEGSENSELGELYCLLGKYDNARKCYERALAIKKEIGDRQGEGGAYCNLGTLYQSLGDYDKAKECHQRALTISVETNHLRGQGVDYGNLGTVFQHLGDYDKAYEHHKKALEIRIRTGHKEGLPTAYLHLSLVCQHLGEYEKAHKLSLKALTTAKGIGDKKAEASILCNLASLEQSIGEHKKAIDHYREALQISKNLKDIKQEGVINGNLGTIYQSLGDLTTAKEYLEKSLAITKQIGSKDGEGTALNNLGRLRHSLGEHAEARECYEMSLALSIETCDQNQEMTTNHNLGTLYLSDNEFPKASEYFKRALQISEQMGDMLGKSSSYAYLAVVYMVSGQDMSKALKYLSASVKTLEEMRVLAGESEYYKIGLANENAAPYRLMISVLVKLECIEMALNISELARARSLAESMATQYSVDHLPGFNTNRWINFGNVIQRKSCTALSFCFVHENLFCWVLKTGKVEVMTNKGLTTDIRPQGACIQRWLETLADQSYRNFLLLQGERCEDRSLFLWDEDAEGRSPTQGEETPSTSQVDEHDKKGGEDPQALKDLYNIIIAPVLKFLEGSEMLVVPDRSLYRIPFAALKDESGEYLSEKFRIRVIPSLTTLKLIQDGPANYHSQKGVLIVGDPEVGLKELTPLPFARKEVEMIGRLLNVRPLVGKQATKRTILQEIHSVSLIHIAAHGNADKGDIALAPAQNIKGILKKEDFVLTMSDISRVQLRAKLVVLSCCHSGRGQIKAEGVLGIARAFLRSGARSVLVSLWAVDDEATMQFMKQFYGHLVRGKSASESLHETMKWMRENPPFCEVRKWAPFMLIGDDVSFEFGKAM